MPRPTKMIVDCSTGVTTEIELNDEEMAALEVASQKATEMQAKLEADSAAKAEAKASAQSKLEALGLSEAEIKAILG